MAATALAVVFRLLVTAAMRVAAATTLAATGEFFLGCLSHAGDLDVKREVNVGKGMIGVERDV